MEKEIQDLEFKLQGQRAKKLDLELMLQVQQRAQAAAWAEIELLKKQLDEDLRTGMDALRADILRHEKESVERQKKASQKND